MLSDSSKPRVPAHLFKNDMVTYFRLEETLPNDRIIWEGIDLALLLHLYCLDLNSIPSLDISSSLFFRKGSGAEELVCCSGGCAFIFSQLSIRSWRLLPTNEAIPSLIFISLTTELQNVTELCNFFKIWGYIFGDFIKP